MAGGTSTPGESVLSRSMRLLSAFDADDPYLTLAELSARGGLPLSTTHRLARELTNLGLLDHGRDGRYRIGVRLWEIGGLAPISLELREQAMPLLMRLYDATGENAHLAVLDGHEALYLIRIMGPHAVPTLSRMGGRHPLHTTGVGKALLMTRDEHWLDRFLAQPLERDTTHSITDPAELRAELNRARVRGYATTREEMTLGNVSIAAPLPAVPGLPPAAIGVVTHLDRADENRLAPLVIKAATAVSEVFASARS
ncbi:IclR family transcriptional regulator [Ruicaihuangia caeni]|uniref:IclR family transcriptional regulator n=1 Tax=Ruicaihuangia caeni TaxID=3042517 RepID=A0AAW6T6A0_9MICO|nr:IclR family transcriptional regulator [Klugiella sp. YN-L-19]MDI2099307.1 IclR family transcriptional regulator [Klugiella sp. YN-L-19]